MNNALATPNQIATAALASRIAAGLIAKCSGKAQDFVREITQRVAAGLGLECPAFISCEVYVDPRGEFRLVIDADGFYWDHVIPADQASRFVARAKAA